MNYTQLKFQAPTEGVFVHTKIMDEKGERNEQIMKKQGRFWFLKDGTYVYFEPTHWAFQSYDELTKK